MGNGQIISHIFLATLFHAVRIAHTSLKDMDINLEHVWIDLRIFWFKCIMDAISKEGFKTTKRLHEKGILILKEMFHLSSQGEAMHKIIEKKYYYQSILYS